MNKNKSISLRWKPDSILMLTLQKKKISFTTIMATLSRACEPKKVKVKSPYHLPRLTNLRLTVHSLLLPAPFSPSMLRFMGL